jgi:hypothetical protein
MALAMACSFSVSIATILIEWCGIEGGGVEVDA